MIKCKIKTTKSIKYNLLLIKTKIILGTNKNLIRIFQTITVLFKLNKKYQLNLKIPMFSMRIRINHIEIYQIIIKEIICN
jgi:hypothetical protein